MYFIKHMNKKLVKDPLEFGASDVKSKSWSCKFMCFGASYFLTNGYNEK